MRSFVLFLLLFVAAPAFAQESNPPYPVERGERVRVSLSQSLPDASGPFYVGSVLAADADSLGLRLGARGTPAQWLAWPDIERVERVGENRTGEALGILVGGIGGASAGYAIDRLLTSGDLSGLGGIILGGLGGLLVGGVVGAHVGDRWEEVPPVRTTSAFRVAIPLR